MTNTKYTARNFSKCYSKQLWQTQIPTILCKITIRNWSSPESSSKCHQSIPSLQKVLSLAYNMCCSLEVLKELGCTFQWILKESSKEETWSCINKTWLQSLSMSTPTGQFRNTRIKPAWSNYIAKICSSQNLFKK